MIWVNPFHAVLKLLAVVTKSCIFKDKLKHKYLI